MESIDAIERDLAHITLMIGMLERLFESETRPSSLVIFESAYWRTRIDSIVTRPDAPPAISARTSELLAQLDFLDRTAVVIDRRAARFTDEAPPGQ